MQLSILHFRLFHGRWDKLFWFSKGRGCIPRQRRALGQLLLLIIFLDFLSSFSGFEYRGHTYGPQSSKCSIVCISVKDLLWSISFSFRCMHFLTIRYVFVIFRYINNFGSEAELPESSKRQSQTPKPECRFRLFINTIRSSIYEFKYKKNHEGNN